MKFLVCYILFKESDDSSNYTTRLNSKEITLPLYVRNKKNGDKMEVKGLNGSKKISDIFIDSKIIPEERFATQCNHSAIHILQRTLQEIGTESIRTAKLRASWTRCRSDKKDREGAWV